MMAPDAALFLDASVAKHGGDAGAIYFFKDRKFACWDVAEDRMLTGPSDIGAQFPGLMDTVPAASLRGVLHVGEWSNQLYFLFDSKDVVAWDIGRNRVDRVMDRSKVLPTTLDGDLTVVSAQLSDGQPVVYGFRGRHYTRWTIRSTTPDAEDDGFPRVTAEDWKDGLVLAPRSGVYVEWRNRSTAHSNRKIYFFMGDLYLRWDVTSNTRNYRLDILAGWKGWPDFS